MMILMSVLFLLHLMSSSANGLKNSCINTSQMQETKCFQNSELIFKSGGMYIKSDKDFSFPFLMTFVH